jgi:ClpP class serine protease
MCIYSEYINMQLSSVQIAMKRKEQLSRIADLRKRDVLVYASNAFRDCPNSIDHSDRTPFEDQISVLNKADIDIILHTPGGLTEVVEDLVKIVRRKFDRVGVIVPGYAYSAGTIFTMAADEILMCPASSLGPIDAQIFSHGKRFSADAFLEGFEKIKREVEKKRDIKYCLCSYLVKHFSR